MKEFILVVLLLAVIGIAIGIFSTQFARRLVPDRYEWLVVLSYHEWKRVPDLIEELLHLKKAKSSFGLKGVIYSDLESLEEEKLIEIREVPSEYGLLPLTEFKLTSRGLWAKNTEIGGEKNWYDLKIP